MAEHNTPHFQVGQTLTDHPFQAGDGAMLELFRNDLPNLLYVGLTNISDAEQALLSQGDAQFGLITSESGGCLIVASFDDLAFEMQFNSAAIPDDYFELSEDNTLKLSMLVIDTATNLLASIREFTLSPELSRQFIDITTQQRQLSGVEAVNMENMQLINTLSPDTLQQSMQTYSLDSVVTAPTCSCGHHHDHGHNHSH